MGMKRELYGISSDVLKGIRRGLSPGRGEKTSFKKKDIKAGAKRILGRKPGRGSFKNLGY